MWIPINGIRFVPYYYRNGAIDHRTNIKLIDITDGTTNTYMIGEKYMNPDGYYDQTKDFGDDEGCFNGLSGDQGRYTRYGVDDPMQDTLGLMAYWRFGSAHSNGFHMAMCDGSVHIINYSIDSLTHSYLGNRNDGMVIDGKKY